MIAQAHAATLTGIDAVPVVIEVDIQGGPTTLIMVGLPDKSVQESQDRVRAAIVNSGLSFPYTRTVVNLAPADLKKEGLSLDLPIALTILSASNQVSRDLFDRSVIVGELGLDGLVRPIDGAVNVALMAMEAGMERLIVPRENAAEAAVSPEIQVYGVRNLLEAVELFNGAMVAPFEHSSVDRQEARYEVDFADVKGQTHAARALEIAAAGGHNVLMLGPPGSGKTMLARRLPTIMPPLTVEEAIEVTRIYSASGKKVGREGLVWERPFRSPHHTSSYAAVVGGGKNPKPGEISLAHLGVLFMDEMPEFDRGVLESLRQPLEDGLVTVARVAASMEFPAECVLIGAMNPCPCGFKGYPEAKCVGAALCDRYMGRISGPLLDRIDLHVTVPRLKPDELTSRPQGESSAAIRQRVVAARKTQEARFGRAKVNAKMSARDMQDLIKLDDESMQFMKAAASKLNLSARVYDRLLRVGRTIADLAESENIQRGHLAEAVQYRGNET
ncbi:MAG: YifB family Mg chelatase-like AAA ATPase [Chthonomonadaceae bacterium]|nr:YifB family Mg chelatase-like AAA ATPase [Chthonomonadaceae bacterium]